ncbi:ATP-dependent DNA helicase recQ [Cordyceps fumosorosea ARSEF 2679]|uniref:DNA 3'-5' helicase n=1 Tax=Cordyceps fumosorosea (strain ARSEF 2679) TaxID=1081104 RepID=A0A167NCA5_CORFA|nr:ATP-dependent DNA helicase recQ [Cordyceps fumosorosea ARSEF 2679]OAA55384.1 ATP-dependent DNA helicase recQ [Cordyceps fumosorosea ARSEF 2679]
MSDFDSGDDLFDGVDADELASAQYSSPAAKRKRELEDPEGADLLKRHRNVSNGTNLADGESSALMDVAQNLLTETFGYTAFRHEQAGAIQRLLAGESALTVFPTGAGKSLCYQIPAFAFEQLDLRSGSKAPGEHGVSIVVSPLIALMKDQVDALQRRNLAAECLDSTKTWEQVQQIYAGLRQGTLRLLYCAPERLNNEGFVETMRHVRGGVRLLAVDEAHCVSEWGHSFRPEYLKVSRFADEINAERVVCLTATATPKVIEDICHAFKIHPQGVFRTTLYRPNLNLHVKAVKTKQEKYPLLFQFLNDNPGPTLVYVTVQQQAMKMAEDLRKQGYDAEPFHAGLDVAVKTELQDKFLANRVRIIVATIAFGMGIDKPDIRNIIHFDLSSTVEEYCQQIGRAGRDGKTSNCMYYVCPEDWYIRENFARGDLPSCQSLKAFLNDIFSRENVSKPLGDNFKTSHYVQSREFDIRTGPLATVYAALELQFGLIRAITPEYSEYKFVPTKVYFARVSKENAPEAKAIYTHAAKKTKFFHVDVNNIVSQTGIRRADIVRKLTDLNNAGVIELKAGGLEQRYRIMQPLPSSAKDVGALADRLYEDLSRREEDSLRRTKQVEDLVTGDQCLALALAQHFGMGLPEGKPKCGHCTHCLTGRRTVMPPRPKMATDMAGIKRILAACDVRDDPRFIARIAFGIKSPRVTKLKLDKHAVFGSLAEHDFTSLLEEFTKACDAVEVGNK